MIKYNRDDESNIWWMVDNKIIICCSCKTKLDTGESLSCLNCKVDTCGNEECLPETTYCAQCTWGQL